MQPIGTDPDPMKYVQPPVSPALNDPAVRRRLWSRSSTYVGEGYFVCRRLRYTSQYKEIPDGSSAITSLTVGPAGEVYGATSGETAHVFVYNPRPPFDAVALLAVLDGETDIRRSLVWEKEQTVLCGTRCTGRPSPDWEGGALYRIAAPGFYADAVQEWPRGMGQVERLCVPVPGEGIAALAIDRLRQRLYGLSDRTGTFFVYDLAAASLDVRRPVDDTWLFSENLMATPDGLVLTAGASGHLVRYDPQTDLLETTTVQVPSYPGRSLYARIDSWVYDAASGRLYVGDKADGLLYWIDPKTLETRLLGKPTARIRIRALTAAPDGRIFGMAGQDDDVASMFVYEPATGELRNLGLPLSCIEEKRYGFNFDSAATGAQGELYFGESERSSRLFVYFPAYKAPATCCGNPPTA
ncbi:MAG: hypothetical protein GXY74_09450 [Phycisphaerae bacterium]|nr:hypothetical protein [Phycisphaerae bacterium]